MAHRYRTASDPDRAGQSVIRAQDLLPERVDETDLQQDVALRLDMQMAVEQLSRRDRELIALRFGADLTVRQIAGALDADTHAVEVALLARCQASASARRGLRRERELAKGPPVRRLGRQCPLLLLGIDWRSRLPGYIRLRVTAWWPSP